VLRGGGPAEVRELTLTLAECVADAPRAQLERWLSDGTAWRKFRAMVEAQGGEAAALERLTAIHPAPIRVPFLSPANGRLVRVDAGSIGRGCVALGAGRASAHDTIDPAVGCSELLKVGARVGRGEPLFQIHARDDASLARAMRHFETAIEVQNG
jgi:thymidine phosphorylase